MLFAFDEIITAYFINVVTLNIHYTMQMFCTVTMMISFFQIHQPDGANKSRLLAFLVLLKELNTL